MPITTKSQGLAKLDFTLPIPAANIVDHDFFDNYDDYAWIDRCANCSWEKEHISIGSQYLAANYANDAAALAAVPAIVNGDVYYTGSVFNEYGVGVTTRAGSRKFPMRGVATAEAARVIIWDITSGQPEMWRVRTVTGASSIASDGGHIAIGSSAGVYYEDYPADKIDLAISYSTTTSPAIVNNTVNSVAITYLPDAPLDAYGMRVPTIAVATDGGVSVIKHDGSVVNHTAVTVIDSVFFDTLSNLYFSSVSWAAVDVIYPALYTTASPFGSSASYFHHWVGGNLDGKPALLSDTSLTSLSIASSKMLLSSHNIGLSVVYTNPTTPANGMVAYLTNTYNTGWMVGDIQLAAICDNTVGAVTVSEPNRSVKTTNLTVTGTLTKAAIGTSGISSLSGFSKSTNYAVLPAGNFDANSKSFSMTAWVKVTTTGVEHFVISTGDYGTGAGVRALTVNTSNLFRFVGWGADLSSSYTLASNNWEHLQIDLMYISGTSYTVSMYANGNLVGQTTLSLPTFTNTAWDIGGANFNVDTFIRHLRGEVALVRISATAPTPEQIKHMYETERKLFEPNAQALLSNSASVTDLRYDKKSGMYAVTNGTNTDLFKDLVRVDSAATNSTLATPVATLSGNRVLAPAVDIGSELSTIKTVHNRRRVLLDFNVVVNGKFSTASGWTLGTGWSIANGILTGTGAGAGGYAQPSTSFKVNTNYLVVYDCVTLTAGSYGLVILGGFNSLTTTTIGTALKETVTSGVAGMSGIRGNNTSGTFDNLFIRESTDTLPQGFKPTKVWAGGLLQEEGTDYDVTFDGFLYGINFFIEPATNVQVEGEYI